MAIPKHHIGFKGDECQCGRRASLMHCLRCGSSRVYARENQWHETTDPITGEPRAKKVDVQWRCQTCNHKFLEEEREFCMAPPVGAMLAQQRIRAINAAEKSGEPLTDQEQKISASLKALATPVISPEGELLRPREYGEVTSTPQEAFRLLRRQKCTLWTELYDSGQTTLTKLEFLQKWVEEEQITIPEGESL